MSRLPTNANASHDVSTPPQLATLLLTIPPGKRGTILQSVVSFRPSLTIDQSVAVGPLRAAFAALWEDVCGDAVPINGLQTVLEPPIPIKTVLQFNKLMLVRDAEEIDITLCHLIQHLQERLGEMHGSAQLQLFESSSPTGNKPRQQLPVGLSVQNLQELADLGRKFPTIYADPPWQYDNAVSRGAADNHYPTMSVENICAEPISELAEDNAHLHLWTTNAFLREAYDVIDAWGFQFKSCLVWVKDQIGMGNYWRVSHEFLLLGVRGNLTFHDRTLPSWIQAPRTLHSRKPGAVRALIEKASPAPYLELYGREELPNSAWTVYGNQIEPRLF